MNFEDFKKMIELEQETHETSQKLYDYIRPEIFEPFWKLSTHLLKQIYTKAGIEFIYYEWITGNKSPLIEDDGTKVPIDTVEQLYEVMEGYRIK